MKFFLVLLTGLLYAGISNAQLTIIDEPSAVALAQKLVGDGVSISNVSFTGNSLMAGRFRNTGGLTNIPIDSGIVLTTGRAKTLDIFDVGMDGDGVTPANDFDAQASNQWALPGDQDLANLIGANVSDLNDACVLEFDFIPSGDTVKFNYVFASEEYYPGFVCTYNDAFGFFISGPGITGVENIALVPGTNIPVSILNVNNVTAASPSCVNNPSYYIDNTANTWFTYDGHTVLLTAKHTVQPCNVYHLKLVVSDFQDDALDTGVFLEAKSLSTNIVTLTNNTQTDVSNNSYIVEGCITGSFTIKRPTAANYDLPVQLTYGGTAVNGVDMQTLPALVVIPANDSMITVNVIPLIDNTPEGIETIKIFAGAGCGSVAPIDSAVIQIRDYDTLTILPNNLSICKNGSVQLNASAAWSTFQWDPAVPGLNDYTINNPLATPTQPASNYICTSTVGTCHGRDSVYVQWKEIALNSQLNVNCHDAATGQIVVSGGPLWDQPPVLYSLDTQTPQANGTFTNLPVGNYTVHITDGSGCQDSVAVNIIQAYPDLAISNTTTVPQTCGSSANGSITVTAGGGLAPYQYSIDGSTFQAGNIFNVYANTYTVTITDANNCTTQVPGILVPLVNNLSVTAGPDTILCAGQSVTLTANSIADTYSWSPSTGLSTTTGSSTIATPTETTTYTVTATLGTCEQTVPVVVTVGSNLTVDAGGPLYIDAGGSVQANVTLGGSNINIASVLWTPAEGLSASNVLNPVITPVITNGTAEYTIVVTNTTGCSATDKLLVNIVPNCINVRNAFTPNGDGVNERWLVYDDFGCLQNVSVSVFNRYGSKVYESNKYKNEWDGRYKGKTLPDGTYYAVVNFTLLSGKVRTVKTDLTILR